MKTSELMLGDWVVYATRPTQIDAIAEGGFGVHLKGEGWQSVGAIEPMRLTPEILEKNGFKNGEFFAELLYREWQIMCDCSHLAIRHEGGWSMNIPCNCVHELQHALRLCGINKEIVL